MAIVNAVVDTTGGAGANRQSLATIEPGDFMNILLKQLQYQDPFEPMDNDQMLSQISQIRNMEMSMTLTESLKTLTEQQRMSSAAAMIGQYVTGTVKDADGNAYVLAGLVRGISFDNNGQPILNLDSGAALPLKNLTSVVDLQRMLGKYVEGVAPGENGGTTEVKGVVSSIRFAESGEAFLMLQDGTELPAAGVTRVGGIPSSAPSTTNSLLARTAVPAVNVKVSS